MAKQNNSDWMSEYQDKELERIEKDISSLYSNAAKELDEEFGKFVESSKEQLNEKLAQLDAGEITKSEYQLWVQKQMLQTDRYKATVKHMTDILVKSDKAAMAVMNGKLPTVVAESYNFSQALGFEAAKKAGLSVGTFQVYNAKSVQKIIKDNPKLLKEVDVPEDKKWNQTKINREITTGMLKGESIPKVSDRLRRVTDMDKNAATRNARTAMTAAENVGRSESAEELKEMGIPVEEVWSATFDKRTRETHILLDGTVKDENGFFGEGILLHPLRYPADPDGDPEEIYNCRCRLNIQIKGIDHSNDKELYEKFMKENDPDSYKRIREVDEPKEEAYRINKEKAERHLQERINRDVNPKENDEKPKDHVSGKETKIPELQTKVSMIKEMSNNEIRDEFINDPNSYIYKPRYQAMTEERKNLMIETDALRKERDSLEEELKGESHVKPKSEWTEDEAFFASLLGDKPTEYTERGEEINDRLSDIRNEIRDKEARSSELYDNLRREDQFNYIVEEAKWEKEIDRWSFEEGNKEKDYEGFSTTMGLAFDKDLEAGKGFIAEMSPDEYLDRIAFEIFQTTRERAIVCDYSNVKEYAEMMANGVKFDMGYLDYTDKGQEGRHRAMAARLLGIEKIPVYIRGRRP